jgi:hypothetical protein
MDEESYTPTGDTKSPCDIEDGGRGFYTEHRMGIPGHNDLEYAGANSTL